MRYNIRDTEDSQLTVAVEARWNSLTKPPGSLGQLEKLVLQLALAQGTERPKVARRTMVLFCGDHGMTEEGVSAFPKAVTGQMVANFLRGGAAINVLCKQARMEKLIVDCGVDGVPVAGTVDRWLGRGTANFVKGPAMSGGQVDRALENGAALAQSLDCDVAAVGEMGIGNTTAASALLCAYCGVGAEEAVGAGTGLDEAGMRRKADVVGRGLARHAGVTEAMGILGAFAGFEMATMAGFFLGAAERGMPVVVDGFIASAAALAARAIDPRVMPYLVFSHVSAERPHRRLLAELGVRPVLDLDLRLGEGSGAALAIPILEAAVALYEGMATFGEAGVG